jgi:cell fate regulator YaaT (PSP1 superfamily)
VEFGGPARAQYCTVGSAAIRVGDAVVVETEWGVGMGTVGGVLSPHCVERLQSPIRPLLRKATSTDLARRTALTQRERDARAFCRERIRARNLPMKLTEVRIGLDSSKAMFYFTAEGRVDFRDLVKDLVQHLHTRVELRQIGVRDEAKVLGCAGACGRAVCCHVFLQAFAPVSIRMAKDQNLALNPGKLSGICGRLKCCLAFEHTVYAEMKHGLPKMGAHVTTSRGPGVVRGLNILEQSVLVGLETGGQVALTVSEVSPMPRPEEKRPPQVERAAAAAPGTAGGGKAEAAPDKDHPRHGNRSRRRRGHGGPPRTAPPTPKSDG